MSLPGIGSIALAFLLIAPLVERSLGKSQGEVEINRQEVKENAITLVFQALQLLAQFGRRLVGGSHRYVTNLDSKLGC